MHSRKLIARLVAVLLVALAGATFAPLPVLAAPIVFIDEGGANDNGGPGQKDLTRHTVDTAGLPNTIAVTWNWDIVTISGNNTADGCALFDTDGDGLANSALCVTWSGSTPTQARGQPAPVHVQRHAGRSLCGCRPSTRGPPNRPAASP